jgi:hypothetical protein
MDGRRMHGAVAPASGVRMCRLETSHGGGGEKLGSVRGVAAGSGLVGRLVGFDEGWGRMGTEGARLFRGL